MPKLIGYRLLVHSDTAKHLVLDPHEVAGIEEIASRPLRSVSGDGLKAAVGLRQSPK